MLICKQMATGSNTTSIGNKLDLPNIADSVAMVMVCLTMKKCFTSGCNGSTHFNSDIMCMALHGEYLLLLASAELHLRRESACIKQN